MAQPKELRRFEIDAIAHRIAEDVKTSKTKAHQKLRKTGAYKKLEKIAKEYIYKRGMKDMRRRGRIYEVGSPEGPISIRHGIIE